MIKLKTPSKTTLFAIIISYLVFIAGVIIFFWSLVYQIASGAESKFKETGYSFVLILFFCFASAFFLGITIFSFVKLFLLRKKDPLAAALKFRLISLFSAFAFIVSIPQFLLAVVLLSLTAQKWLPVNTEKILSTSYEQILASRNEKVKSVKDFATSATATQAMNNILINGSNKNEIWKELRRVNNFIFSIQVFDLNWMELAFLGKEDAKIDSSEKMPPYVEGDLPLFVNSTQSFFRYLTRKTLSDNSKILMLVTFEQGAEELALINDLGNLTKHFKPLIESREWMKFNIIFILAIFVIVINLISIIISLFVSSLLTKPILEIEEITKKVSNGDFSVRFYQGKNSIFYSLSNTFNLMIGDLEKLQKNSDYLTKMKVWQDIARRMAHEINNPLTPIQMAAQRMLRQYKKDPENFETVLNKSVNVITAEVDNLKSLLEDFKSFSKLPDPNFEPTNLFSLISDIATLYENRDDKNVTFNFDELDKEILVPLDKTQIHQVLSNLIKNAIEASGDEAKINISSAMLTDQNIRYCRIMIQDFGKGIPEKLLENIWTPYWTTKEYGTGLGLAIVERIIFSHKGKIRVTSKENVGTTFIIDLPMENKNE